jgi:hypothetical protein
LPPEKIDSLADDVKPLVLELLRQISGLTARVDELVMQNKALLARIAELEAEHGKPPKTPDNSSLPPSRGQKGNVAEPTRVKKARKGHPGAGASARREPGRDTRHLRRTLRMWRRARRGRSGTREGVGPCRSAADQADHNTDQSVPRHVPVLQGTGHRPGSGRHARGLAVRISFPERRVCQLARMSFFRAFKASNSIDCSFRGTPPRNFNPILRGFNLTYFLPLLPILRVSNIA